VFIKVVVLRLGQSFLLIEVYTQSVAERAVREKPWSNSLALAILKAAGEDSKLGRDKMGEIRDGSARTRGFGSRGGRVPSPLHKTFQV